MGHSVTIHPNEVQDDALVCREEMREKAEDGQTHGEFDELLGSPNTHKAENQGDQDRAHGRTRPSWGFDQLRETFGAVAPTRTATEMRATTENAEGVGFAAAHGARRPPDRLVVHANRALGVTDVLTLVTDARAGDFAVGVEHARTRRVHRGDQPRM